MSTICECRFLGRTLIIDDISKRPHCKNIKFKRAFQFLQLLLIQRVYGIDVISRATAVRSSKYLQRGDDNQDDNQNDNYEVFLGGSCNPTTWRHEQAIPYFQSRSVSYYNPQVADWTPDLIEIEHRAKESAPLLFFVIDYDTRALASIIEVCYLAARGRNIIVVMNPMPEKNQTKFIQQKHINDEKEDNDDYENVCEARQISHTLLRSIDIPVFDDLKLALRCAAFLLETTKRSVSTFCKSDETCRENEGENDTITPLPKSICEPSKPKSSSVVVIRSLSNQTTFDTADEFYRQMNKTEVSPRSRRDSKQRHSISPEPDVIQFGGLTGCAKSQFSNATNESDDDGYISIGSSDMALSPSSLSLTSESFEAVCDQSRESITRSFNQTQPTYKMNKFIVPFLSYIPFVSSMPRTSSMSQSLFTFLTIPIRFIKNAIRSGNPSLPRMMESTDIHEPINLNPSPYFMFDLYIASGATDECWLNSVAVPALKNRNINFIQRQYHPDNDQIDILYDIHARKQSRLLYYLINSKERLSNLATELAFLVGERKHKIVVYLGTTIDENIDNIKSPCERRDIQRSRKYLEDVLRNENIHLFRSVEQSWQYVLAFFQQDKQSVEN